MLLLRLSVVFLKHWKGEITFICHELVCWRDLDLFQTNGTFESTAKSSDSELSEFINSNFTCIILQLCAMCYVHPAVGWEGSAC
jgi:hypothetical protein